MRKLLLMIMIVLLCGFVYAVSCQKAQGIVAGNDCNIFVFKGSTATTTDLNLWDTNSQQLIVNQRMFDVNGLFATYNFRTHGNPTEYMFRVTTATATTTICGGGYFKTYDLNVDSRIKDANSTISQAWLDVNSTVKKSWLDLNANVNLTHTDINNAVKVIDLNIGKIDLDLNANINLMHTDINNAVKVVDKNLGAAWLDLNRSILVVDLNLGAIGLDLNANINLTHTDINNNIKTIDKNLTAAWFDINAAIKVLDLNIGSAIVKVNGIDLNVGSLILRVVGMDTNAYSAYTDMNGSFGSLLAGQITITGNQATISAQVVDTNQNVIDSNSYIVGRINDVNTGLGGLSAAYVWNYLSRDLTDYNQSEGGWDIWGLLFGIDNNAFDINAQQVNILLDINSGSGGGGATAAQVWSYATRTVTDYNQDLMFTYLGDINSGSGGGGATAAQVWSYATRALSDNNALAKDIWDYNSSVKEVGTVQTMRQLVETIWHILTGS